MSVTTEKFRVQFLIIVSFLFTYVSVPMLLGIGALVTAAQRARKTAPYEPPTFSDKEKYDLEEMLDDDPDEIN